MANKKKYRERVPVGREYLERVIHDWREFGSGHRKMVESVEYAIKRIDDLELLLRVALVDLNRYHDLMFKRECVALRDDSVSVEEFYAISDERMSIECLIRQIEWKLEVSK